MKTVQEIMDYLRLAMAEAFELHDQAKDKDEAYFQLIVGMTIKHLIEEIEQ